MWAQLHNILFTLLPNVFVMSSWCTGFAYPQYLPSSVRTCPSALMRFRCGSHPIGCSWITPWSRSSGVHHYVRSRLPWQHWRAASFFDPRPRGQHRRWHDYENPCHSRCQTVLRGSTLDPEHAVISVTSCLADLGWCTDCQQGGLLQLGSCWYLWPASRPVAVRLDCRRPFGFLSEAVRTHNPIAPWASLVASSGASHIPAVRSGLLLSSWNSADIPCWEPSPDIWRRHSTSSTFCWHSRVGGIVHQTFNTRWPCLPSGFVTSHVRRTACHRLSGMHHRWRHSVASWRLYFIGRRSTMIRRSWLYCTVLLLSARDYRLSARLS